MRPQQIQPLLIRVDLEVMAMKGYSSFPRSPKLEPQHLMTLSVTPRKILFGGGLTPMQETQSTYSKPHRHSGTYLDDDKSLGKNHGITDRRIFSSIPKIFFFLFIYNNKSRLCLFVCLFVLFFFCVYFRTQTPSFIDVTFSQKPKQFYFKQFNLAWVICLHSV